VQKEPLTPYGYEKMTGEMEHLKNVERPAIIKEVEIAREHGDLKENAEYHAAREKQRFADARLMELQSMIANAQIIDPATLPHERVSFGSTVVVEDVDTEEEMTYVIVGGIESNPDKGIISFHSPLAKILLGKEEGDVFEARLPGGVKELEILEVGYKEIPFE
jgi:transcription elongation factor GreA